MRGSRPILIAPERGQGSAYDQNKTKKDGQYKPDFPKNSVSRIRCSVRLIPDDGAIFADRCKVAGLAHGPWLNAGAYKFERV